MTDLYYRIRSPQPEVVLSCVHLLSLSNDGSHGDLEGHLVDNVM